jgi:mono/diheme cytochrome c family protein
MTRGGVIALAIVLAVAAMAIAAASETSGQMFDGAYVYDRSCATCHGASGEGVTLFGPPLAGDAFVISTGVDGIGYVINMGRKYRDKMYPAYSGMPRFQFITGGELEALIDYVTGPLQAYAKKPAPGSQ